MSSRLLHDDFVNIQCQVHKVDIYFNAMFNIFIVLQGIFFVTKNLSYTKPIERNVHDKSAGSSLNHPMFTLPRGLDSICMLWSSGPFIVVFLLCKVITS